MIRGRIFVAVFVFALSAQGHVFAQDSSAMMQKEQSGVPLSSSVDRHMCEPDGIAVGGYDLISYRQDDGPIVGDAEFAVVYADSTFLFSSRENSDAFNASPEKYLPEYNGFCAITLALGRVTCPQYDNFKIEDDRLLLFEVTGFTNGRTLWNSDSSKFRANADTNYGKLFE